MAHFLHHDRRIHYELISFAIPDDTIFIHGNLASNRWWEPTFKLLQQQFKGTDAKGSLCAGEWLGCGQSSEPETEADLEIPKLAQDYVALAKGLGLSDVNLVAHSTGGLIALAALKIAPEIFKRAVLLDSVSARGIQFGPEMYDAFTKMSEDKAFCDEVMASTIHRCKRDGPLVKALFDDAFHVSKKIWHGVPNVLKATDLTSWLKDIKQPVLVMHGEFDTLLPIAGSKEIANALPNGEFFEIKGHGHCTNVEDPEKFVDLVCEFLY